MKNLFALLVINSLLVVGCGSKKYSNVNLTFHSSFTKQQQKYIKKEYVEAMKLIDKCNHPDLLKKKKLQNTLIEAYLKDNKKALANNLTTEQLLFLMFIERNRPSALISAAKRTNFINGEIYSMQEYSMTKDWDADKYCAATNPFSLNGFLLILPQHRGKFYYNQNCGSLKNTIAHEMLHNFGYRHDTKENFQLMQDVAHSCKIDYLDSDLYLKQMEQM